MNVGLTYTGSEEKHQYYADWLRASGNINVIRLEAGKTDPATVNALNGLVLSGGRDIDPRVYGSSTVDYAGAPSSFDHARDDFEITVFREAANNQIPVLGICRGLQLINCALGGDLKQDLGAQLDRVHQGNPDKQHTATIYPGTLLHQATGADTGEVNSAHHQAVGRLAPGLQVNAVAPDGTIEGVEWMEPYSKSYLLAVQWHPERMFRFGLQETPLSKKLRESFITAMQEKK